METRRLAGGRDRFRNDYRNKIEAGYAPIGQTSTSKVTTDIYQWENVPKAVVEGPKVPERAGQRYHQLDQQHYLHAAEQEQGDRRPSVDHPGVHAELYPELAGASGCVAPVDLHRYGKQQPKKYNYKGQPVTGSEKDEVSPYSILGLSATWDVTKTSA